MKRFIMTVIVYISFAACQQLIHEAFENDKYWIMAIAFLVYMPGAFILDMLMDKWEGKNDEL